MRKPGSFGADASSPRRCQRLTGGWLMAGALALLACGDESNPDAGPGMGGIGVVPGADEPEAGPSREPPLLGIAEGENVATGDVPRTDVVARDALEMLEFYCGSCHANGQAQGGLGDVLDIPKLIERGLIVPGSSETSPLLDGILDGPTHPMNQSPYLRRPTPTPGEIALLAQLIDELRSEPVPGCEPLPFLSHDDAYTAMFADIATRPTGDRPFVRYLGVGYASNAGLCGPALEQQRHALFKAINSVSTVGVIRVPQAIDAEQLIYRIDIRDYGWARPIDLEDDGTVDHADGWLALTSAVGPYGVELRGPEADALKVESGTSVPFLPVNAFVYAANANDLYYALIGAGQYIYDTQTDLGIDIDASLDDGDVQFAGFQSSRPPRVELLLFRVEQPAFPERYFWSLIALRSNGSGSIYTDPFDMTGNGEQTIFNLPNGLQAYSVSDGSGARLGEIPADCVNDCYRPEAVKPAACHSCHALGIVPFRDTVRDFVQEEMNLFDRGTFAAVQARYPIPAEFDALAAHDSEVHMSALEAAGVPRGLPDPISRVFSQYELADIGLERAAAELGVTRSILRDNLGLLDPRLGSLLLTGGVVDRNVFTTAFAEALCMLHAGARNRPARC